MQDWISESFAMRVPVLFIGACGICVRMIAPFVNDKLKDSAVLVLDEAGQYVIPVLSGHVGGANALARRIAAVIGAEAVITTATDVNKVFSADVFAQRNGLLIKDRAGIRQVSAKLLRGETVSVSVSPEVGFEESEMPEGLRLAAYPPRERTDIVISEDDTALGQAVLPLFPRLYVMGVGCKKGTAAELILSQAVRCLEECGLASDGSELCAMASIDLKAGEHGLLLSAAQLGVRLYTYSAQELAAVPGSFTESEFVQQVTGVSNVCERAAVCHAGPGAELILKKCADTEGVTIALAKREVRITTWET